MDPKKILAAYRASCQAKAQRITRFIDGRKGFDLSLNEAKHLDAMVGVLVDQIDDMEDSWDDITEIVHRCPVDIHNDAL